MTATRWRRQRPDNEPKADTPKRKIPLKQRAARGRQLDPDVVMENRLLKPGDVLPNASHRGEKFRVGGSVGGGQLLR